MPTPYLALATDYDGTLATDGQVDRATLNALEQWKAAGRKSILITGRRLDDFQTVFSRFDLFDLVIAENGALLYRPADQTEQPLSEPPPDTFIQQLQKRILQAEQPQTVPGEFNKIVSDRGLQWLAVGRVIVATWTPHDVTVQEVIQELGIRDLQIIMNKGAVMILPVGVDKGLGLRAAAQELQLPLDSIAGVGDAENDTAFLALCGYSVAVANALPELKERVNWVSKGERGAGVVELIDQLLELE
jgi:HAD superfamily hydrolase (TIGR01484 family)